MSSKTNRKRTIPQARSRRFLTWITASLAAGLIATLATPVLAAQSPGVASLYLEDLTSPELAAQIAAGKSIAIIPIGGTEQSGPVIALGKHNVRVKILSGRIANQLGDAIVAPVIAYVPEGSVSPPSGHMRFAGTLSISDAAFNGVLTGAANSLRQAGFRDIVFLGDHGGYQANIRKVCQELNASWGASGVRAHALPEYYDAAAHGFAATLRADHFTSAEIGTHAGLADTSLMLATDPTLVRTGELATTTDLAPVNGVYGDPRKAAASLGDQGVADIIRKTVAAIRAATARTPP